MKIKKHFTIISLFVAVALLAGTAWGGDARAVRTVKTKGHTRQVRLNIQLPALLPSGLIVREVLPAGWSARDIVPAPAYISPDGNELKWVFAGNDVLEDMTIQYAARRVARHSAAVGLTESPLEQRKLFTGVVKYKEPVTGEAVEVEVENAQHKGKRSRRRKHHRREDLQDHRPLRKRMSIE